MNIDDFIHTFRDNSNGLTLVESKDAIDTFIKTITDLMLDGDSIQFRCFGELGSKIVGGRQGRNPNTNEPKWIEPRLTPYFKASKMLKDDVAGK